MYNTIMSLSNSSNPASGGQMPASDLGLYPISVVTELTGIGPGTLRGFERAGLLAPARTDGGTRRYSGDDLARLARISALVCDGVNLAGVSRILVLERDLGVAGAQLAELRAELGTLRAELRRLRDATAERPGTSAGGPAGISAGGPAGAAAG
jgi:DNA-binding transcriptional MerR regulator